MLFCHSPVSKLEKWESKANLAGIRAHHQEIQEQGDADRLLVEIQVMEARANKIADDKFLHENIIRLNNDRTQSLKQQVKYMNVSED